MRMLLVLAGTGVVAVALTVALYPRDTKPVALVPACDVLTKEIAESLIGPNSRSNDDNAESSTQCQYMSSSVGRNVNLSAQRVPARGKAGGVTRAHRRIRSLPGDPTPVAGIGDEAYVHVLAQQNPDSPMPAIGPWLDLTVRADDVLVRVHVGHRGVIGDVRTTALALARSYLAKIS